MDTSSRSVDGRCLPPSKRSIWPNLLKLGCMPPTDSASPKTPSTNYHRGYAGVCAGLPKMAARQKPPAGGQPAPGGVHGQALRRPGFGLSDLIQEGNFGLLRAVDRFGLADGQPRSLEQISHVYGVTRKRIRQTETTALAKLRRFFRSQPLRSYSPDAI